MRSSPVAHNIVANFAGKAWTTLMWLIFIPLYVRLIGIESYGLIGVFASLTALISILDMGLSTTLSRELARVSVSTTPGTAQESRDLVRTLEIIYWGAGIVIAIGLATVAPVIAQHWLRPSGIPEKTVARAITIMGLVIAIQWPSSLYEGGLTGLQRQVLLNGLRTTTATIQHAGAVLVLWLVSPSIVAYFTWQIIINVAQTLLFRYSAWRSLPPGDTRSSFHLSLLKRHWWFATGMTGISILAIILTQADKIILSRLLPLTVFGYYVLAVNLASILAQIVSPLLSALFPRFTQLFAQPNEETALSTLYHSACQGVSVLVLPAATVLVFFPRELLSLWIHDPIIAQNVAPLARLLVIGQTLNALVTIPYMIQLAFGWTRLVIFANAAAVIVIVPLLTRMVTLYGVAGGAIAWIILNSGYFLVMIPVMHRRLFKNEMWQWYRTDVGIPLVAVVSVVSLSRILMPNGGPSIFSLLWIAATGIAALLAASAMIPFARTWMRRQVASSP